MVTQHGSNTAQTSTPVAPVVKRKRRASCLGEQERRERKRAIDREAQRSLREKTKTHIAELERTIQILRDQDRNGATASLLSEIETLRAENERLRDVIDSVKSVVGGDIVSRSNNQNGNTQIGSPPSRSPGGDSPGSNTQGACMCVTNIFSLMIRDLVSFFSNVAFHGRRAFLCPQYL